MQEFNTEAATLLFRLRLIIARAGERDSLQWWEDDALTQNGMYLLERIFPGEPSLVAANLALAAASSRHNIVLSEFASAIHLYRMDHERHDELAMSETTLFQDFDLIDPIPDMDALHRQLLLIMKKQPRYEVIGKAKQYGRLQIRVEENVGSIVEKAQALAWAYLEGKFGQPVFPYLMERA